MKSHNFTQHDHFGIVLDIPPEEVAPERWTNGLNIQFQEQSTRRVGGYEAFADPLLPGGPLFAINVLYGAVSYWIYTSSTGVFVTDGTQHFDLTPPAGLLPVNAGDWTGTILNGIPVINNGRDAPMYWDFNTANPVQTIPGWPAGASCKVIRSFKYHLFALNIFDGSAKPDTLWWSEGAAPGAIPQEWTPSPSNDAGDMVLADAPGVIIDGMSLRDTFIVYKDYSTYALSYVAGQYIYTQRKLFLTSGLQARNCIAEIQGEHWLFTGTDVIRHDGQNAQSVVQDKVKLALVKSIEPSKTQMCCVSQRTRNQQFWVAIPETGNDHLTKAYVINTLTGDVGIRELPGVDYIARGIVNINATDIAWDSDVTPVAWDNDVGSWDQQNYSPTEDSLLMCDAVDGKLWSTDTSDSNNGQPVYAYIERQSLPINDNILRAMVTRVIPRLDGMPGEVIQIRTGGQAFFGQPISWSDPKDFTIGQSVAVDMQTEGRLISVRFEASTMRQWTLHSYKLEVVDLGLF
jgi:hypothetical protein